ncbi:MAG: type II toxin-antitoxin system HicB family antitoxin [Verrucomicrobiae bacterium]|nr:type II toxin-antitoxin system HicB family antitoxin [Verrucomicrobiae bacterium]MCP5532225.1 type II toxin-antitoxin system HicB family antitoxin [Akkermansiaceae bacterium]MCP5544240.1 type II toxin-antitoxin system HicB family antitoxin [Akkermansiaceae bacterium]MCP5547036.1 type II toxin-antitoxin system HicB family antitoxin [Akkermansiaceae bacterium]
MNYAIAIEHEPGKAYGVEVPDLPGCFSAGHTLDEAISNAAEAIAFHIEGLLDDGGIIPSPQGVEIHSANPDYAGRFWALVSVDLATLSGKSKRLNISLPERVLRRIDSAAAKNGETRSGFIARIALESA